MKQRLNKRQITFWIVVLMAVIFIAVCSPNFGAQSVAYADSSLDSSNEIYYGDYSEITGGITATESFSYATKSTEWERVNPYFPEYTNFNSNLDNACANVAGANVIGFYDRYFDELIPDCTVGYLKSNNKYKYYDMLRIEDQIQGVINDLYGRMGTNVSRPGTTQTQYKNGLSSYVQSKGRNITFSSVMTNGSLDISKVIAQLKGGKPISLYMSGYNFTEITDDGSNVSYYKFLSDTNHIAIVFGYEVTTYYRADGSVIRTEVYLDVAPGIYGYPTVYVVNNYGTLNDAEAVQIA